ncbi:uncharacterized protein LOC109538203 isoform X3 [Dendroctonus ponderosae]|uniref:uncharacterized protein LOC109538203 isoform X3 n=1 Tax=Dendroctonus ponderosae TaxID=77166 RepID=UPI0020356398|nr:uncharacterized protein LOC109538203 isoform X3 [Dendroctonus ponderosae]
MRVKFALLLFVYAEISRGEPLETNDQDVLSKNLKIMRQDFNNLVENVEDFLDDFVKQIRDAEKMVENVYINDDDYNWQENSATEKLQINEHKSSTSPSPNKPTNLHSAHKARSKLQSSELSNEIDQIRKKRALPDAPRFDNRVASAPLAANEETFPEAQLLASNQKYRPLSDAPQEDSRAAFPSQIDSNDPLVLGGYQVNANSQTNSQNNPACISQTQEEKQKFEDLKTEVRKLSELVSLLKDQQKMIKELSQSGDNVKDDNSLESSYLYNTLKRWQLNQDAKRFKIQNDSYQSEKELQSRSTQEIDKLKADLKQTEQHVTETQLIVNKEKEKEAFLEMELKRQNREIKFLKALMENVYDKTNAKTDKKTHDSGGFRTSDFEDIDIDSVLGVAHTPKPWPWPKVSPMPSQGEEIASIAAEDDSKLNGLFQKAAHDSDVRNVTSDTPPNSEPVSTATSFEEKLHEFQKKLQKKYQLYASQYERDMLNNKTISALMQLTKTDPDRFQKFEPTNSQEYYSEYEREADKIPQNIAFDYPLASARSSSSRNSQIAKRNNTLSTARASGNSKLDDLEFKLKLIDLLTNADQNINNGNKNSGRSIKDLLQPPKKSDDEETLEAFKKFLNEREKSQKTEGSLSELLKAMNDNPQSKSEDSKIEAELKDLQRAINNLRPKQDTFGGFDLEDGVNGKNDLQTLLSQAISHNGANLDSMSPQASLNIAAGADTLDKNSLAAQQFLSQSMSHSNPDQLTRLENLIKSYASTQNGNQAFISQGISGKPILNVYGPNPLEYSNLNSNLYSFYPTSLYNPNANRYVLPYFSPYSGTISNKYDDISNPYINPAYPTNSENYNFNVPSVFGSYPDSKYQQYLYSQPEYSTSNKYWNPNYMSSPYNAPRPSNINYPNFGYQPATIYPGNSPSSSHYEELFDKSLPHKYANSKENYGNYQNTFREPGRTYQDLNYGSSSYSGPNMGQPFGTKQNPESNKFVVVSDLTQQIENLENVITSLTKRSGYSQTPDDTASIMSLQQRIYDLKVIRSLNEPKYYEPSQNYQINPQTSGAAYSSPVQYNPSQQLYEDKTKLVSYIGPKDVSYSGQNRFKQQPTIPYKSGIVQQAVYSINSPPSGQTPQLVAEPTPSPPQQSSYQPATEQQGNAPYVPKETEAEHRGSNIFSKTFNNEDLMHMDARRGKRHADEQLPVSPKESMYEYVGRTKMQPGEGKERPAGYDLGEDTFTQLANVFKKYIEENMNQPRENEYVGEISEARNHQSKDSVLNKLQQKLDELKLELEFQKSAATSVHNIPNPLGIYHNEPTLSSYEGQYNYPNRYNAINHAPIQTFATGKRNDAFTEVAMKILEKVGDSLPQLISRVFGNIFSDIGNSYGDNYSELQTVLKNLGRIGLVPIVLVKILESAGNIFKELRKNQLFRQFLMPGLVLGLIGGAVLFIMFFFQQDESYGRIEYQQSSYPYKSSQHESSHYNSVTSPGYNTNYRQANANIPIFRPSNERFNSELRNGRTEPINIPPNGLLENERNAYYGNSNLQYSRGYSDYSRSNFYNYR